MNRNHPIRAFVLQFSKAIIAALTVVLISRWLGAEQRGELSLVLFAVNLIMVANEFVGGSSLGNLVVKYPLQKLLPFSKIWAIAVCCVGSILYYFFSGTPEMTPYVALIAFPLSLLTIHYSLYHGFAAVNTRNVLQLVLEIIRLVALLAIAWFAAMHGQNTIVPGLQKLLHIHQILMVYGISAVVVLVLSFVILWPRIRYSFKGNWQPTKELIASGFWSQNGQLVQFFNYRLNLVFLTYFLTERFYAGVYSNALLIADSIWIFGNSFAGIAHMRMLQSENPVFRADITLRYAVISFLGTAFACTLLFLIPNSLFVSVFGADFTTLRSTALMLVPAILALGGSTLFSHYLHAKNQFKTLLVANICGLVVQVILAALLIPGYKIMGACIAADAGFILIFIIVFAIFKRQNPNIHLHGKFNARAIWRTLTNAEL